METFVALQAIVVLRYLFILFYTILVLLLFIYAIILIAFRIILSTWLYNNIIYVFILFVFIILLIPCSYCQSCTERGGGHLCYNSLQGLLRCKLDNNFAATFHYQLSKVAVTICKGHCQIVSSFARG